MSGKNRAFALAVATAALVGLSAPVASAASFSGPNSGFNGDSVLNLSGNQLPLQACNNQIPVNVLGVQVPLSAISAALGVLNGGTTDSSSASQSCSQTPSQSITSPVTTTTSPMTTTTTTTTGGPGPKGSTTTTTTMTGQRGNSGFNGDSVLQVSNNQLPLQACNNNIPVNVLGVQVPVDGLSGVLGLGNQGGSNASSADRTCAQTPSQANNSSVTTNS